MALDKVRGPEQGKERSQLSRTIADYGALGASAPDELVNNPGKTLAETMSDEDLARYMGAAVAALDETYASIRNPDTPLSERAEALEVIERKVPRLATDIRYLRSINRLPSTADFDPQERYTLE